MNSRHDSEARIRVLQALILQSTEVNASVVTSYDAVVTVKINFQFLAIY